MNKSGSGQDDLILATIRGVGLGDLPLGSAESRARAMAVALKKRQNEPRGYLFEITYMTDPPPTGTECTCKIPGAGAWGLCQCFLPTKSKGRNQHEQRV